MIRYEKRRWSSHLFDIRGSMLLEIVGRVSACVLWSLVVVTAHHFYRGLAVPATAHTLVGAALGLLLVFRTNASYDRYWEGRRQWGAIINEARNLGRAARAFLGRDRGLFETVVLWTAAFPYAAMQSLRKGRGLGPIARRLPEAEVDA